MKVQNELQKNHQEVDNEVITGYMPELPGDPMCPVDSLREYLSHLNPEYESLWQPPITKPVTSVWFANSTVGDHTISDFMKNLSKNAGLSKKYTNHDIRVTGLSILGHCNFSDQQIMAVSGHKSVESLKVYKKVSDAEKFMMGYTLGYALKNPNAIPNDEDVPEIEYEIEPKQPKKKKQKIQHKQQTDNLPQIQLQPIAVPALQTPNITSNATENDPKEHLVDIPDEYDFDLMALVADMENDKMEHDSEIAIMPQMPQRRETALPPPLTPRQINSLNQNTQINLNKNHDIPSFNHCQIGTINFNIIKK